MNKKYKHCSNLKAVHITDIAAWCKIEFEGSSSNPLTEAHHLYLNGEEVKDLVIPNSVTSIEREAFAKCKNQTDVYCYAEKVRSTSSSAFEGSYIEYATLHVPTNALNDYKTTTPWSGFGTIKSLEGGDQPEEPEVKICATSVPSI